MIDYALSTEYCEEVNASQPSTALCRVWSAAGGIAAERKLQTKIKECEGTAMKKAISLLLVIVMTTIALAGCGKKTDKFIGTWKVDSIEIDGAKFTVSELKAMGDDSMCAAQIVIKTGGKPMLLNVMTALAMSLIGRKLIRVFKSVNKTAQSWMV